MATLLSALHDVIDEGEELRDEARDIVDGMRQHIIALVEDTGDTTEALEAVALLVEAKLGGKDGLMRRATRKGFRAGQRRLKATDDEG